MIQLLRSLGVTAGSSTRLHRQQLLPFVLRLDRRQLGSVPCERSQVPLDFQLDLCCLASQDRLCHVVLLLRIGHAQRELSLDRPLIQEAQVAEVRNRLAPSLGGRCERGSRRETHGDRCRQFRPGQLARIRASRRASASHRSVPAVRSSGDTRRLSPSSHVRADPGSGGRVHPRGQARRRECVGGRAGGRASRSWPSSRDAAGERERSSTRPACPARVQMIGQWRLMPRAARHAPSGPSRTRQDRASRAFERSWTPGAIPGGLEAPAGRQKGQAEVGRPRRADGRCHPERDSE